MVTEVARSVRSASVKSVGPNLFEDRRVVRQIPQTGKRVERPRGSSQIVVVLFPALAATETQRMGSDYLGELVMNFIRVLGENRWSIGTL